MAENRHDDVEERHTRYAEDRPVADKIPRGKIREGGGDVVGIALNEKVVGRTVDDQRDQRRYEGAQPQIADQQAVHGAQQHAADDGCQGDERHRPAEYIEGEEGAEVGQREHRAHRKVDAADDDHERHAERDESDLTSLPRRVGEARRRQEIVDRLAEPEADDQQDENRNGGFGPALREYFTKPMVGPIAVAQANNGFSHRKSELRAVTGNGPAGRLPPGWALVIRRRPLSSGRRGSSMSSARWRSPW